MKITDDLIEVHNDFIHEYNTIISEINDCMGGILELEDDMSEEQEITNWLQADRSVVHGELFLMELWNELVKGYNLECKVYQYMLEYYQ